MTPREVCGVIDNVAAVRVYRLSTTRPQSGVSNQLNVMKAIGAIETMPDAAEGVLWTNAYNK